MTLRPIVVVAALAAAGCVTSEPINLSSSFAPAVATRWATTSTSRSDPCDIMLVSVRDARVDTQTVGALGRRIIRTSDAAGWVRSGFGTLNQDSRIRFVEQGDARPSLGLNVELLKVNASNINMAISSSVAVRVNYTLAGAPAGEMIFRGVDNVINWASGDSEVQSSLDRSLQEVITAVDADILARCGAPATPAPASVAAS